MFNLLIDIVTLPVNIVAAVTDELTGTEINDSIEFIKDEIKI